MKKGQSELIIPAFIVIFALLFGVIALGVDSVPASSLGVKEQFGIIKGVQHPGVAWTGLFTSVNKYDLRTNKVVVNLNDVESAFDKTGQAIYATIAVNYRIIKSDETVTKLYAEVGRSNIVADRLNLNAIVIEGFKQSTVKYDALEILDKQQEVKELAKENIRKNFPNEYFEIQDIVITNIDFSNTFKLAIENKKVAEQDALKEQNKLEAVKFQQLQEIEKAKAEAEKMRLQKAEVSELLNQQKWIEKWNGVLPSTVLLTSDSKGMAMILNVPAVEDGV